MIEQAMKFVQTLADSARKPHIVHVPDDPPHVSLLCMPDGTVQRLVAAPGARTVTLYRIEDLVSLANTHFDKDIDAAGKMAIFHDAHQAVLVFDTGTGRETAVVNLIESDESRFFGDRLKEPLVGVAELRRALRYVLPETQDPTDIELLEKQVGCLGTEQRNAAEQVSRRDRESLGVSVTMAVAEKKDMPRPEQRFNVRPFHNPDLPARFPVDCLLDPEPTTNKWLLWPLRSSWWQFLGESTAYVRREIVGTLKKGIPVYTGRFAVQPGQT